MKRNPPAMRPRMVLNQRQRIKTRVVSRQVVIISSSIIVALALGFMFFINLSDIRQTFATGETRYAVASGNWNSTSVWSATLGGAPGASVPGTSDDVIFMNGPITVTVTADASCNSLQIENAAGVGDNILFVNNGITLTVTGNVNIDGSHHSGNNQDAKLIVDGGILTVGGNLTIGCHNNQEATLDLSNGTNASSVLNIAGNFTNSAANKGKFLPGTNSTINFNGTSPQTINISNVIKAYANITINNSAGASLAAHLTPTTLTGNLRILSGTLYTEGYSITPTGNTFEIADGAQIVLMGASAFPSGFGTVTLQPNSTVDYAGTAKTVAAQNYGNLTVSMGSGSRTVTLDNSGTISAANTCSLTPDNNTYSVTGSTFRCNGTSAQTIRGTFYNLVINSTAATNAVTLNAPVTVQNNLTLTDGHIVTTATNILTLDTNATITLNAPVTQDSSFIKGPMIHTVASSSETTKVFPVGKNNQMHRADLTVTHSSTTSTQYTGEYINSSASALGYTLPGSLNKVSDIGHWDISKSAGASVTNASVNLNYFSSDFVSDAAYLRIAKDNGSGAWIDLGGTGSSAPSGNITSTTNFISFSRFSLANNSAGANPLPIKLSWFRAEVNNLEVDLYWTTSSETNNDYFTIEKSRDAENFETVTVVNGAGNSNSLKSYQAVDSKPFTGDSYYRLKQTDYDGKFTFSQIVPVSIKSNFNLSVFPNPIAPGQIPYLKLTNISERKEVRITIHDASGKELFSKQLLTHPSGNAVPLDFITKLIPGYYFVRAVSDEVQTEQMLVVQ